MQLTVLLGTLALALVAPSNVLAAPTPADAGVITVPLKRLHTPRTDLHPQLNLQRHINHGRHRLARMNGRAVPTHEDMAAALTKRVDTIEARGEVALDARYKRELAVLAGRDLNGFSQTEADAAKSKSSLTDLNIPKTAVNSLGLSIQANDIGYVARLAIGTAQIGASGAAYRLLVDTSTADLWVGSENCKSSQGGCGNHNFLGPKVSRSFFSNGSVHWDGIYAGGHVSGDLIQDFVNIVGHSLFNHTFGVANIEAEIFASDDAPIDGFLGTAQAAASQQHVPPVVDALKTDGGIKKGITSYKISRLSDGKNDGELSFGGLDASKFDQNTFSTVANVNSKGLWEVAVEKVQVNGTDQAMSGRTGVVDTGSSILLMPQADADALHKAIPGAQSDGQGGYTLPCTTNTFVALTFGGHDFTINPSDLSLQPVDPDDLTGECVSAIAVGGLDAEDDKQWLLGDTFLKNVYTSLSIDDNTVSFAELT
ncbi:acid protease [Dentipellis sp. KUC8613]|nr:acid protease [Dentipellis sp. KUC8613]